MLAEEHPECLHSLSLRSTLTASQRYLTADVREKYMAPERVHLEASVHRQWNHRDAKKIWTMEPHQKKQYPEDEITTTANMDLDDSGHSRNNIPSIGLI